MTRILAAAFAAAFALSAGSALAQPPPGPGRMADSWDVESHGQVQCVVRLSSRGGRDGTYRVEIPLDCANSALPDGVSGWRPTPDGMVLVGADGQPLATLNRWSESLYVASGGRDLALARAIAHGAR